MSIENNLDFAEKDELIRAENEKVVNDFVSKYLSENPMAEEIFGKTNLTRRDRIKNYHGKIYVRNRFIKCENNLYGKEPVNQEYFEDF